MLVLVLRVDDQEIHQGVDQKIRHPGLEFQ
jgi:hypothetical protein